MRGIILAGGTGSRLGDLTKVVNKHLLPVGSHPMIYWPILVLKANSISDITIVSTPRGIGQLAELLGGGYTYQVQDKPGGITEAIACADNGSDDQVVVILGDNIFLPSPRLSDRLKDGRLVDGCARCWLKQVPVGRVKEFGAPTFDVDGNIEHITEKPFSPPSCFAVTGLYMFSSEVFERASGVKDSVRGEMEITDLLNLYATQGALSYFTVDGFWGDAGTIQGMAECTVAVNKWGNQ